MSLLEVNGGKQRAGASALLAFAYARLGTALPLNSSVRPQVHKIAYNIVEVEEVKYKIVLKRSKEGYSVSCPGLPGCWSQGQTEKEAIENIQVAIQEYLAAIEESLSSADVREIEVPV